MKVRELIERLSDYDPDEEVMLAFQPSWPLAYKVRDVVGLAMIITRTQTDEEEDDPFNGVVWIVEGGQNYDPYAPSVVFNY